MTIWLIIGWILLASWVIWDESKTRKVQIKLLMKIIQSQEDRVSKLLSILENCRELLKFVENEKNDSRH